MNIEEATPIVLSDQERSALEAMIRSPKTEHGIVERARIVLLAAEGRSTRSIATELASWPGRVSRWRTRFARERLAGLRDLPRPGAAPRYDADTDKRILARLDQPPPAGYGRWTAPLLSRELGDVSDQYIWRFLRANKIDLAARKSWCQTDDPDFVAKAAEIVGLYLDPPQDAIVLAVDEKPHIQALERAQGYLKLPGGRALGGHSHDYKRHGTSTLFAALELATGQVTAAHYKRRRRVEFLDFMNSIVADYPDKQIHVILDNLSTHKPKRDRWLARHPNVRLHFTPTYSSWLNQIEIWFSILQRNSLAGASFTDIQQLRDHIDAFVDAYNARAVPFVWTKAVVHHKPL
ncbi:IS630 family transposase [Enhydrobacter sp.]|jgi:transposase|uniref:IS630 family transposase n=1 Tax=Enhydrobacter sp. TaxID=1894999 RepID=UPI00261DA8BA|nr:IS630 family transposase [Enhydrobacter sp.]WIM13600.1 MAG: Mobile element protein [Enhydrobacter sp.]